MSTVIIALIIVGLVMAVCLVLISINNRQRRKAASDLVTQFQHKGKENNLRISKWESAGNLVIGLEKDQMKILAFRKHDGQYKSYLVDLSKVKHCLKQKIYERKISGYGRNEKYEKQVEQIYLQFDFADERPSVQIPFYDPVTNHLYEMAEMEQRTTDWEQLVNNIIHQDSKMIS